MYANERIISINQKEPGLEPFVQIKKKKNFRLNQTTSFREAFLKMDYWPTASWNVISSSNVNKQAVLLLPDRNWARLHQQQAREEPHIFNNSSVLCFLLKLNRPWTRKKRFQKTYWKTLYRCLISINSNYLVLTENISFCRQRKSTHHDHLMNCDSFFFEVLSFLTIENVIFKRFFWKGKEKRER